MNENASPPPPPPASPPPASPPTGQSDNRSVMIVLSYVWLLALIPLLVEKDDKEVQWHAKHGLVLLALETALYLVLFVITSTGIGCIFGILYPVLILGSFVVRIICIVKGLNNQRFEIPGISQYASKF